MRAALLNQIGLLLGMTGVVLIFRWGPPQPSFEEQPFLAMQGPDTRRKQPPPGAANAAMRFSRALVSH